MKAPKYTSKKLAVIGVTAGLVAGAGAGLLMNLPGGASAKSPVGISATGTEDDNATDAPASSIGGEAGEVEGQHHGGRHGDPAEFAAHLREELQSLVDAGTIDASELDAIVAALTTPPADDSTPPADDSTPPAPGARLSARLQSLVDDGTLTTSQRDAVVAAIGRPDRGPGHGHGPRGGLRGEMLDSAASAIGITVDELTTELRAGKTIAEVAVANGKTAQQVIDALVSTATAEMTQRITDMVNGVQPTAPSATAGA